ncbi:MAG: ATPase, partial [Erysipelotrichia bacterium]|nr:ATPase [Erysipelotrichia bacterium]
DCDVEEPNGHLFLKPEIKKEEEVEVFIPEFDEKLCNGCRKCVDFCNFGALAFIKDKPMLFSEICHSCDGCRLICPTKAIQEVPKKVGTVIEGTTPNVSVYSGSLKLGEASGVPIIKALLNKVKHKTEDVFIDCPPGSACVVMESIQDADYCILVAEPTIFGMHNLAMVYELVKLWDKPTGVVLNKCSEGYNPSEEFCEKNNIPIIGKIPFNHNLGKLMAKGNIAVDKDLDVRNKFTEIYQTIRKEVAK